MDKAKTEAILALDNLIKLGLEKKPNNGHKRKGQSSLAVFKSIQEPQPQKLKLNYFACKWKKCGSAFNKKDVLVRHKNNSQHITE